ncbi:MAG TPA: ABC transporter ATP-binding protein [Kiritimatiellia bacterium]|nr:ABC transporter ATP-binding protein [Kiritimatiellia bacterium]HMO98697.1 ABC transporter ATP-binding protein [Kiritimatiellia bacterium]HMP90884.1 ABC transporter ATP-binding protein [Kiritimatiellia bacterium]
MTTVIKVENLSKQYRLGVISAGTLRDDVQRWWHNLRGKEDPLSRVDSHAAHQSQVSGLTSQVSQTSQRDVLWALRDVSFEVEQGTVLGIIGRNGAGKSTLLKILSRVTGPTSGTIKARGRIASLLEVGTGFHPELTGRENVFLNGAILGMTRAEVRSKFDAIVDFAEITRFIDTPVKRYSSGMYVRLAFAVAAHLDPEILVIDEVLAVGDVSFQRKCLGKMGDVAAAGRTVLFVSHNMSAVKSLTHKALYLRDGCIADYGDTGPVVIGYLKTTSGATGLVYDLRGEPRGRMMGDRAFMTDFVVNQGLPIRHGDPVRFEVDIECRGQIEGVAMGLGFCSAEGARIMSIDSELTEAYWHFHQGKIRCEIVVPRCDLQPASYLVDLAIRSGDGAYIDYLAGCAKVDVLPGEKTPAVILRADGQVRCPATWRLRTQPAS